MSAALIDLVSVGAQDVFITGDPEVSFFRQNYNTYPGRRTDGDGARAFGNRRKQRKIVVTDDAAARDPKRGM